MCFLSGSSKRHSTFSKFSHKKERSINCSMRIRIRKNIKILQCINFDRLGRGKISNRLDLDDTMLEISRIRISIIASRAVTYHFHAGAQRGRSKRIPARSPDRNYTGAGGYIRRRTDTAAR